jgi:hypothetical protein
MNSEEKAELDALCKQIVVEKDHNKFIALVMQLNQLLERKEQRLHDRRPQDQRDPTTPQS